MFDLGNTNIMCIPRVQRTGMGRQREIEWVNKTLSFPKPLVDRAEKFIKEKGLGSFSELVRMALHDYLERHGY